MGFDRAKHNGVFRAYDAIAMQLRAELGQRRHDGRKLL
jgi:hypothetical protein